MQTTLGWDTQGLHDRQGRPYKGIAWYQFAVEVPVSSRGKKNRITVRVLCNSDVFGANGIYEPMFLYSRTPAKKVTAQKSKATSSSL